MNRRGFLSNTAAAGLAAATLPEFSYAQRSPNDTVNIAIVGLRGDNSANPTWTRRGQGQIHFDYLSRIKNVRISHVVDIDERHFKTVVPELMEKSGQNPETEVDVRRVLDDPEVDAITIAVPDHWHALISIWACQAGKDVYVEKPVCHNISEGRRMIEAARKYHRVVQAGTQRRSGAGMKEAIEFLHTGGLGKVYMAKSSEYRPRAPIGKKPVSPVPTGVHYDLFTGPAPSRPFTENIIHYNWHWV